MGSLFLSYSSEDEILWWFALQGICRGFDLDYSTKTEYIHVWSPEELFVVARICQFLLYFIERVGHTAYYGLSIGRL